jgi:cytoskeletal protein CcmA (bactofilin family)
LTLSGNLHIDGDVKGIIRSEADVAVGRQGRFQGDIHARRLVVSGELNGTVDCEWLEIVAGGRVNGEVTLEGMMIESGGFFEGQSRRKNEQTTRTLAHEGRKTPALSGPDGVYVDVDQK